VDEEVLLLVIYNKFNSYFYLLFLWMIYAEFTQIFDILDFKKSKVFCEVTM
jgi:hypothetical protein